MRVFLTNPTRTACIRLQSGLRRDLPDGHPLQRASGEAIQIADLLPFTLDIGELTGNQMRLLAEGLRLITVREPTRATQPVWAQVPEAFVNIMQAQFFPTSRTLRRYIWHLTVSAAATEVSLLARSFPDGVRGDASALLALYQSAYSSTLTLEDVERLLP